MRTCPRHCDIGDSGAAGCRSCRFADIKSGATHWDYASPKSRSHRHGAGMTDRVRHCVHCVVYAQVDVKQVGRARDEIINRAKKVRGVPSPRHA